MKRMTDEELAQWVTESRARCGLPPQIEDPAALERCAEIFRLAEESKANKPSGDAEPGDSAEPDAD